MKLQSSNPRNKSRNAGFSLAEVMVAMFVIVVGIAGVTSSLWWATKNKDSGREMTEASNHARTLMEALIARNGFSWPSGAWPDGTSGINDAPTARQALFAPPFQNIGTIVRGQTEETTLGGVLAGSQGNMALDASAFTRNIQVTRLAPPSNTNYNSDLASARVAVYWNANKGRERKVEMLSILNHGAD